MNIKTITCHDVYNSGASLQAYALQRYVTSLGHSVEIIDYKPEYLSNHFDLLKVSNPKFNSFPIKWFYLTAKLPRRVLALRKKRSFDRFRDQYLRLTCSRYGSNEELKMDPPPADVYIAGSDQIWNTLFPNGRDAAFYLNFAPKSSRRISYAASFATSTVEPPYIDFVRQELKNFDAISVREQDGLEIINSLGYQGSWVCDPVFLLSPNEWNEIATQSFDEKYLLIYDFERTSLIEQIAKRIAREKGLKIYSVNIQLPYADRCFLYASPDVFVSLIRQAQLVISNSFHGTAFSVIYQREFLIVPRKEGINSRMVSLLNYLNIPERMVSDSKFSFTPIDYDKVERSLGLLISRSKQFLDEALR